MAPANGKGLGAWRKGFRFVGWRASIRGKESEKDFTTEFTEKESAVLKYCQAIPSRWSPWSLW
jgi:hypothetical protein